MINSDALGHLEKAIELDPHHLDARLALADLYRRENLFDEAKSILSKTIAGAFPSGGKLSVKKSICMSAYTPCKNNLYLTTLEFDLQNFIRNANAKFWMPK